MDRTRQGRRNTSNAGSRSAVQRGGRNAVGAGDRNASHTGNRNVSHTGSRNASHTGNRNVSHTGSRNASYAGSRGAAAGENGGLYVYGNNAQVLELQRQIEEAPAKKPSVEVQKNREKARRMNFGYMLFLGAALVASAYILVNYLQLQAELTNLTKTVAAKTSTLIDMKADNEEAYNRVVRSINLDEIRRVAISVLGMVYADETQIVVYESEPYDYMRQVTENSR